MKKFDNNTREQAVAGYMLGEAMHESWRKGRLQEDGTFTPRWKGVEDKALNDKTPEEAVAMGRDASEVIDIANTSFADLPAKWQGENLAAGQFAARYYTALKENPGLINNKEWVEQAANEIHVAWSERNSWEALASVPYDELDEAEKQKDRDHLTAVSDLVKKFSKGEIDLSAEEQKYGLINRGEEYEVIEVNVMYPTEDKEEYEFVLLFEGENMTRNFCVTVNKGLDYELVETLLESQIMDFASSIEAAQDIIDIFCDEEEW